MDSLSKNLRRKARELGLSHAEVARRAGLAERRYGHYVSGDREPNLATLLRICTVLATTPSELLEPHMRSDGLQGRERLHQRLIAASNALSEDDLELVLRQVETLVDFRAARRQNR